MDVPMKQKTDAEIIDIVLKGDSKAYAIIVEKFKTPIFNLAYRMTGNRTDAEDLTQEIFIRAYLHLNKFNPEKRFFTWLYTIALNLIRNHLKTLSRRRRDESQIVLINAQQNDAGNRQIHPEPFEPESILLETSLLRLPSDLREVIVLRYYQGLSFEEIASITGKSQSAVKMRTYRGLEKLKKTMNL